MSRIVIAGAGIGGLCAARAVALAGHEPVVLERNPGSSAVGAGLLLWPNAVRALDALGHGDAVRAIGAAPRRMVISDAAGRALSEADVEALGRRAGAPMLLVERPALHAVLGHDIEVRHAAEVESADDHGVQLASGERVDGDGVIGADGVGSIVRRSVDPSAATVDSGFTVVRGISEHDLGDGRGFEVWGRGAVAGGASLGGGRTYWFFEARAEEVEGRDPRDAVGADRWPAPLPELLAGTPDDAFLVNRIVYLKPMRDWVRGCIALLGDAAHAMEPNVGQGAAQTIEDAAALLGALRSEDDLAAAFANYARRRRRRAHMIQRESSRFARIALSRHAAPRNLMARLMPELVQQAQFRRLVG